MAAVAGGGVIGSASLDLAQQANGRRGVGRALMQMVEDQIYHELV